MREIQESTITFVAKKYTVGKGEVAYVEDAEGKLMSIVTEGTTLAVQSENIVRVGTAAEVQAAAELLPQKEDRVINVAEAVLVPVEIAPVKVIAK